MVDNIVEYFKKHPLLLIFFIAFFTSSCGFFSEYLLLNKYGLNIGFFASFEYFFLAGVSDPYVLLIGFFLWASAASQTNIIDRYFSKNQNKINSKRVAFFLAILWVFILITLFLFFIRERVDDKYNAVLSGNVKTSSIMLRENNHMLSGSDKGHSLITATDMFMIFYQYSDKSVVAIPIENIASVNFFENNSSQLQLD